MSLPAVFFACVFAVFLLHCGGDADRAYERGSTVIIAHPGFNGAGLSPRVLDDERNLLFLPLTNVDESGDLDGALAESWDYSPETGAVTYHLRTNVRWHDGVQVTAHDVKFSMDLMTRPDVLIEVPSFFGDVEVLDDYTLRVTGSSGGTDEVFWPKHLLENLDPKDFDAWDFWTHPVGNGPYRFVTYQPFSFLELEANPDYFKGKPAIDRAILKFVGDAGVRELMGGAIDAVCGVRPIAALALADDARFDFFYQYDAWWVQSALWWQHRSPLFEQPEVRRALTLAIDRREIQRLNRLPESTPIVDAPYSRRQLAGGQFPEPIPYDPDQAKSLLDHAGWIDHDGDGIREKSGREFRFTAIVSSGVNDLQDAAIYIREQLRAVGVEMEVHLMHGVVVFDRIEQGDFEAALGPFTIFSVTGFPTQIGYENEDLIDLSTLLQAPLSSGGAVRRWRPFAGPHRSDLSPRCSGHFAGPAHSGQHRSPAYPRVEHAVAGKPPPSFGALVGQRGVVAMTRRDGVVACLALAGLSLHCCDAPDRAATRGSTVVIAQPFQTESAVAPFDHQNEAYLLFLPLIRINESGELEGALAESCDYDFETNTVTYR